MSSHENNIEVYAHVLNVLDDQLADAKRDIERFERQGWVECLADAKQKWDHWALLYDAVHDGLIADLAAASEKYKAMAGSAVTR